MLEKGRLEHVKYVSGTIHSERLPAISIYLGNLVNKSQDWRTLLNWIKQFTPIWSGFPEIQTELAFPLPPPSGQALPARVANPSGPSAGPAGPSGSSAFAGPAGPSGSAGPTGSTGKSKMTSLKITSLTPSQINGQMSLLLHGVNLLHLKRELAARRSWRFMWTW